MHLGYFVWVHSSSEMIKGSENDCIHLSERDTNALAALKRKMG